MGSIQQHRVGDAFIGILAIVVAFVLCFSLISCNKTETEKKTKGTVVADNTGTVLFKYSITGSNQANLPDSCVFTTNLPAPNGKFTLYVSPSDTTDTKIIEGLHAGQKVTWETNVEGHPMNHGSGNFVHIINN
ncbi:MAG: hypothetical protein FWC39_01825 [Bacteroidetes bacterium]|nr:hypothetical protein [Bacteroidota bacterium]